MINITKSQNRSYNQYDENHKKHGRWKEYLDKYWRVVSDSNTAVFWNYMYYNHGERFYYNSFHYGKQKLEPNSQNIEGIKKPIMLDGEYKWYNKKGRLLDDEVFNKGEPVTLKQYHWSIFRHRLIGKQIKEYIDLTKKYKNQPMSFYYESFDKNGNKRIWYGRDGYLGWKVYEEEFIDSTLVMPEFPGGNDSLKNFIDKNLQYPFLAQARHTYGTVKVKFTVETDGSLSNIKPITSLGSGCETEAERVVKLMPKWKPGKRVGKIVPIDYILPFKFSLKINKLIQ